MYIAEKGLTLYQAVEQCKEQILNDSYEDMEFNGISIRVGKYSDSADLLTIYYLKHKIRRLEAGYKD